MEGFGGDLEVQVSDAPTLDAIHCARAPGDARPRLHQRGDTDELESPGVDTEGVGGAALQARGAPAEPVLAARRGGGGAAPRDSRAAAEEARGAPELWHAGHGGGG